MSEVVKIEINGWKDESILAKQSVNLLFVEEGSEAEVVEVERLVKYEPSVLPEKLARVAPVTEQVSIARVGGSRGIEAVRNFLTKMSDGTYVIAVKAEIWESFRRFIEAGAYVIRRMTERSVAALAATLERAFEMAREFEAEEAEFSDYPLYLQGEVS